jgi:muconolactone delta-isomerase
MEFLVEFVVMITEGTPSSEVEQHAQAEAVAAAELAEQGHLERLWVPPTVPGETKIVGLYRAADAATLDGLLRALPMYSWMQITVTPLQPHPNDPGA